MLTTGHTLTEAQFTTKVFEFKLRPHKKFIADADIILWRCRQLYNACLEQRVSRYQYANQSISWVEQCRELTELRAADPDFAAIPRDIQTDVVKRLDKAYAAFFRRLKSGEKAGFPRFKGRDRYSSFEYAVDQRHVFPLNGNKLTVKGIGTVRVRLSRQLPIGAAIKIIRIVKRADGWYAQLVCTVAKPEPLRPTGEMVGIDVGIESFATLSNGEQIENPRILKRASEKLEQAQRVLSRRKKGSKGRKVARVLVAKKHLKVSRTRKHFHYQVANRLVKEFDLIAVEKLNVRGMVKNHNLAQSISDVAWSSFLGILETKAEEARRIVERVDAKYTSQICSSCGRKEKKELSQRWHSCPCGCELHRDHNAAQNIRARGVATLTTRQRVVGLSERDGRHERQAESLKRVA